MTNITDLNEHKKKYASNEMIKETLNEMVSYIEESEPDTEHDVFFSMMKDSEGAWSMSLLVADEDIPELVMLMEDHREILKQMYYGEQE